MRFGGTGAPDGCASPSLPLLLARGAVVSVVSTSAFLAVRTIVNHARVYAIHPSLQTHRIHIHIQTSVPPVRGLKF